MLHINGLTYRIGARLLLDQATVAIPSGHKVGLVGPNGIGKTTLLHLISGDLQPGAKIVTGLATSRPAISHRSRAICWSNRSRASPLTLSWHCHSGWRITSDSARSD